MCAYCGKPFCADCLVEVNGRMYCKADLGHVIDEAKASGAHAPAINISNVNTNTNTNNMGMVYAHKSKIVALILCIFFGTLGIHRFYVGKIGTGILWFITLGFFGIGWLVDIIMIAVGAFSDNHGMKLQ